MAASYRSVLALFVVLFILQQNLMAVAIRPLESRKNSVLGPPVNQHRVPPSFPSFTINRYKKIEADAFRPTSSGHSPGVGHFEPPTAVDMN